MRELWDDDELETGHEIGQADKKTDSSLAQHVWL
jgi:hypothetical protein